MPTTNEKEIIEYKEQTREAVAAAETLQVTDYEGVMDAADFLLRVKRIGEQIASRKEEITKPLNEALKSARKLFKDIEDAYASAEGIAKVKVLDWHQGEWGAGRQTDNKISGIEGNVTVVERMVVEITDDKAIPRGLCSPDKDKIEHYLLSGKKVKGAKLVPSYTIAAGKN